MLLAARTIPTISVVVRWPHSTAAAAGKQLLRRLNERTIAATWAIEHPAQAAVLNHSDLAMLVGLAWKRETTAIISGLQTFRSQGLSVAAIQCDGELPRGNLERQLSQTGVRAVITGATRAAAAAVRPLPFGLTQLAPNVTAPAKRGWLETFRIRRPKPLGQASLPAIVVIDLARIESSGKSAWGEVERLLGQIDELRQELAKLASISQLMTLIGAAGARPQRSILRKAA